MVSFLRGVVIRPKPAGLLPYNYGCLADKVCHAGSRRRNEAYLLRVTWAISLKSLAIDTLIWYDCPSVLTAVSDALKQSEAAGVPAPAAPVAHPGPAESKMGV